MPYWVLSQMLKILLEEKSLINFGPDIQGAGQLRREQQHTTNSSNMR